MFPSSSSDPLEATRCVCVCSKYNHGLPHNVSSATWYRHLDEATTQEEKQRIRSVKALGVIALSNLPNSESSDADTSISRGARRADTLRALTQRARESEGSNSRAGRRKRAKLESIDDDNIISLAAADEPNDDPIPDNPHIPNDDPIPNSPNIPNDDPIPNSPNIPNDDPIPNSPNVPNDDPVPDSPNIPNGDPIPNIPNVPNGDPIPNIPNIHIDDPVPAERHILPHQYAIQRRKQPLIDVEVLAQTAILDKLRDSFEYIMLLKNATLEDRIAKLNEDALMRLRHPPNERIRIVSPGTRQSIAMYLALEHASQDAYNRICRATARNFAGAEGVDEILSFYSVEKLIAQYTGVDPLVHDMCPNTCLAFTGPFADEDGCPMCGMSRWDQAKLHASNGRDKVAAQTSILPIDNNIIFEHNRACTKGTIKPVRICANVLNCETDTREHEANCPRI